MVRRCSDKMAKLLLVVFNALFVVCGIALLVVGLMDIKNARSVDAILSKLNSLNVVTIFIGAVILIISFLGCCGALKENSCMLNCFLGLLLIILIAEVTVGYLAFDNRSKVESAIKANAFMTLNQTKNSKLLKEAWDDVQLTWQCCGVDSADDYALFNLPIPESCCKKETQGPCGGGTDGFHANGCFPEIKTFAENVSLGIGVAAVIIAFIEVAGIIFACCLRSAINERYETV